MDGNQDVKRTEKRIEQKEDERLKEYGQMTLDGGGRGQNPPAVHYRRGGGP